MIADRKKAIGGRFHPMPARIGVTRLRMRPVQRLREARNFR